MNTVKKGYYVVDDILYYEGLDMPGHHRVVVPAHLRHRILEEHHDLPFVGHFAAKKMSQRVRQYFYWNGLTLMCIRNVHLVCHVPKYKAKETEGDHH